MQSVVRPITRGGLFLILASSAIFADPILSIQPPQLSLSSGSTFSLDVDIQGAADVYAFQFNLNLSTTLISPVSVTEGSFLPSGGSTFFVPTMRAGQISAVIDTLLGPVPGVSGNGTLATLNFTIPTPFSGFDFSGSTTISLSNVILLNSHLAEIPATTVPGVVNVVPEPATWGLAAVALLGSIGGCRRKRGARIWIATAALLLRGGSAKAAAPGYTFTILAQTGDTIDGKILTGVGGPIINNAGTVVFYGTFDGGSGIFTPARLLVQTGDTIGGEILTSISQIAINNLETVVFLGKFDGGAGIFTPSAPLVMTGDLIDGKTLLAIEDFLSTRIGINDGGTVVFEATFTPFEYSYYSQGQGIFTNSVLVEADPIRELYNPQINNAGTIVFAGVDAVSQDFISTQSGIVGGGEYADYPVINNAGSIAYVCGFESAVTTNSAICTTTSDRWGTGTTISGQTLWGVTGFAKPALNDAGTLVFNGVIAGSPDPNTQAGNGIFTPSELLIFTNDAIAGKSVTAFGTPALNNSGVITFAVSFVDGTSGIILATPISTGVAGDVNNDGVVDCTDLAFMKPILGKTYGQVGFDPRADMNGDGVIDIRDLAFVAQYLPDGTSCP